MIKRIMLFLISCIWIVVSYAQDVTLWKQIVRFNNDYSYWDQLYISTKYHYRDTAILYKMDYADNGWQVYDSISYKKENNLWYISYFDAYDPSLRMYHRFSDTTQNLHSSNNDIHYAVDKYGILPGYLDGINEIIFLYKKNSPHLIQTHIGDTCCYYFEDGNSTLLFGEYGVGMEDTLKMYCCHIGEHNEYARDKFLFSSYTFVRFFEYDKYGNVTKVTIIRTNNAKKEKDTWIESFILTPVDKVF